MFDTPLFVQYPGTVRDRAEDKDVNQRNASEFEAFIRAEAKRRGVKIPHDWIRESFMPAVAEISKACFAASSAPYIWELSSQLGSGRGAVTGDAVKAAFLEPDGAFLFVAVEVLIDEAL